MSLGGFALGFGAELHAEYGVPSSFWSSQLPRSSVSAPIRSCLPGKGKCREASISVRFRIGVSAEISLLLVPALDEEWIKFEVCGEVDLFFFSLEGCVTIEIGEEASDIPDPTEWPLKSVALADHLYTKTGDAVLQTRYPTASSIPTVWPDAIPILEFSSVRPATQARPFTDKLIWDAAAIGDGVVGTQSDPEVAMHVQGIGQTRRNGIRRLVQRLADQGWLRAELSVDRATDIMFTVHSHAAYRILVVDCGWTVPDYKAWQYHTLCDQLLAERARVTNEPDPIDGLSFQTIEPGKVRSRSTSGG